MLFLPVWVLAREAGIATSCCRQRDHQGSAGTQRTLSDCSELLRTVTQCGHAPLGVQPVVTIVHGCAASWTMTAIDFRVVGPTPVSTIGRPSATMRVSP